MSSPDPNAARVRHSLRRRWPVLAALLALAALLTVLLWPRIVVSIHPGEAGVLFRLIGGTQVDRVYGEGLHVIFPLNTLVRYELRKQVAMHAFDVLVARGLPVRLEIAVRYRPRAEQLGLLHQRIGPDYAARVVLPQSESVLRRELSRYSAEQIYTNESGLMGAAVLLAREEVGRNFVDADEIVIRTVALPAPVKQAIEDKLTQRQIMESYVFRLRTAHEEAERLRAEARGVRDYQAAVGATLTERVLHHEGIRVTSELAASENAKVLVIGSERSGGLPLVPGAAPAQAKP